MQHHMRSTKAAPLKAYDVELWPLDACRMRVKARSRHQACEIASRSWLDGDDITAFMAEPDYWTVEEVLAEVL